MTQRRSERIASQKVLPLRLANHNTLFSKLSEDIWLEIFKSLSPSDFLNLRLVSNKFNSLAIHQTYKHYRQTLFPKSAKIGNIAFLVKIYDLFGKKLSIENRAHAFNLASANGQLEVLRQLYEWHQDEETFTCSNCLNCFCAFVKASSNGHLMIIQQLYSWCK